MSSIPTHSPVQNAAAFSPDTDNVFSRIATRYDSLCDIFSVYAHRLWKNHIAGRIAADPGACLLDVASGTGDIPMRVLRRLDSRGGPTTTKKLFVTDICPEMLAVARSKLGVTDSRIEYALFDAQNLSQVESNSIDIYSISFGMKILDRARVLSEARRVLKPGGKLFCLEAARIPVGFVHSAYLAYMDWCLPLIATLATNDRSSYDYLLRGVHDFPCQDDFARQIEHSGFTAVSFENLTFGIVALHEGTKH